MRLWLEVQEEIFILVFNISTLFATQKPGKKWCSHEKDEFKLQRVLLPITQGIHYYFTYAESQKIQKYLSVVCILLILHILSLLFHQALDQRFSLCAGVKGVYK